MDLKQLPWGATMQHRITRLSPLSGLAFCLLLILAFVVLGGNTPDSNASTTKVVSFYKAHHGQQQAAAMVLAFSAVFLLWFVTILRTQIAERGSDQIALATLAGGIVMTVGYLAMASSHFVLGDVAYKLDPAAAQALNAFDGDTFLISYAGALFMLVALATAVLRVRVLPRGFGYVAIVFAVAMLTPIGWIAWMLTAVWVAIAGIVLAVRAGRPTQTREPVMAA